MKSCNCKIACPVARMSLNAFIGGLSGLFGGLFLTLVIYGIAYLVAIITSIRYFTNHEGIITIIMIGMGFGALIGTILGGRVGLKVIAPKE